MVNRLVMLLFWVVVIAFLVVWGFRIQPLYGFFANGGLYVQGYLALQNQDYRQAIKLFKPVTGSQTPFTQEALAQMGYAYSQLNMPQQALNYYLLCVEQSPKHYTAQLSVARLLRQLGWAEDAKPVYQRLLETYPGNQPLMVEVAETLYFTGNEADFSKALRLYEEGLGQQAAPPLAPWLHYAELAFKQRQLSKALGLYCQVLGQEKAPPEAMQALAMTLAKMKKYHPAAQWLEIAAVEISPTNPDLAQLWEQEALALKRSLRDEPLTENSKETTTGLIIEGDLAQACLKDLEKHPRYSDAFIVEPSEAKQLEKTATTKHE